MDNNTDQSETTKIHTKFKKRFKTNHTIKNAEAKIQIKPGCYSIQQKARPIPYHLQDDVKNELDRIIKSGHLQRLETIEEDCFVSPDVITVKKDKTVKMVKKGVKWVWTEERNTDFNNLKKELTIRPCLAQYNGNKENIVTTDACNTELGIALWQRQNNELKAIAYASRYLNDAEKKYSVGELELLAVVWGLERFRFHLHGKHVQLCSDH